MRLEYFAPSRGLTGLVSFHYVFETSGGNFAERLSALLGQVQFRVHGALQHQAAGLLTGTPSVPLMGPLNQTMLLECADPMTTVGCGLLPAGWALLVREHAGDLADRVVDARAVWGAPVDRAYERIGNAQTDAARVAALDAFLCGVLARNGASPDPRLAAIDRWIGEAPHARLDDLIATLEVSARHAERIVMANYGASPKLLAAKYRALRASALLATGQARDWRDAGGAAYADQAHFIRDFRRFVGAPPVAFTADRARLARLVMHAKWSAGARSPLALWS